MAENKNAFVLYCDLIHTVRKMPKDKVAELFLTILAYVNDEHPVVDDILVDLVFEPIKQQLKRDLQKYDAFREKQIQNGKMGGRPKKQLPEPELVENPNNPSLFQETQKSLTVTDTDTVKERKNTEASPTHALAIFVKDNLPNVSKLKNQLTDEQCEKLVKEFNKTTIKKTLEAMENRSDLTKKYRSVYLTLNNWLSREPNIQTNGNFSPSTSGPQTLEGTKIKFTPKPQQA